MPKPISKLKIPQHQNVWEGPSSEGKNGGISQSMLGSFLQCRERFRIKYVLGLKPAEQFNRALEYGNMWHLCEEFHASGDDWEKPLQEYTKELMKKYQTQQPEIDKWYNVCLKQFPIYVEHWSKHKDTQKRTGLLQEEVFHIPYTLPSGRVVYLRGKFDGVDLIGKGKGAGIYLFETKTKGEIVEEDLKRQLNFDMQTMMYLVALQHFGEVLDENGKVKEAYGPEELNDRPIKGVRYNVVRRPLSGGRGTIKQLEGSKNRAPETKEEYYDRLQQYFIEDPAYWFMRWTVEVSQQDIENFKIKFLNPILEQLCDWWEFITGPYHRGDVWETAANHIHWMHPWGAKNHLDERGVSDYDEYIRTGNAVGLRRVKELFGELK